MKKYMRGMYIGNVYSRKCMRLYGVDRMSISVCIAAGVDSLICFGGSGYSGVHLMPFY